MGLKSLRTATAVAITACAALSGALVLGTPTTATAAGGCYSKGPTRTDYWNRTFATWYCNAYQGGEVGFDYQSNGYLYAGTSWFVCQMKIPGWNNPQVGGAQNDWWLYTQGDTATDVGGWGWFPATKISGGANWSPIPGNLPDCRNTPGF